MILAERFKRQQLACRSLATNATVTAQIDTLGYRHLWVNANLVAAATDASHKWLALKFTEGDTTVITNASAIVNLTGTTNTVTDATNGFVIVGSNDTTVGSAHQFLIPLRGNRKRYLFFHGTAAGTSAIVSAEALLSEAENSPETTTAKGVIATVRP